MKGKKNIDDLFKDSFENFEASAPADTWDKIAAKLQKKKKERKVIPIWWRVAGVAALMALLFTIGNSVFGPSDPSEKLSDQDSNPVKTESVKDTTLPSDKLKDNTQLAEEDEVQNTKGDNQSEINTTEDKARKSLIDQDKVDEAVADEDVSDKMRETDKIKGDQINDPVFRDKSVVETNKKKEAVADEDVSGKIKGVNVKDALIKDKSPVETGKRKEAVALNEKTTVQNKKTDETDVKDKIDRETIKMDDKANEIIDREKIGQDKSYTDVAKSESEVKKEKTEDPQEEKKRSIFDAIEENEETEAVAVQPTPDDRWEVTPNVGPVYYSSLGEGSSIDPAFADNSQSGDVNLSYGANISYAVSEKLSVRTGINNVNLSYTTGDVELGTGPVSSALRSIDYGGRQFVTTAVDKGALQGGSPGGDPFDNITPKSAGQEAFISQSLRYYEVPLELKYSLFNNKFGMHLIGGFSSLFLADNEVSVEAGDFRTVLGEANNLNSLSFTSNIGLGFDYKIGKRLKFNIEPMFKYQLNPYTDSSVDFNPFYLGVYTGLSFKF